MKTKVLLDGYDKVIAVITYKTKKELKDKVIQACYQHECTVFAKLGIDFSETDSFQVECGDDDASYETTCKLIDTVIY